MPNRHADSKSTSDPEYDPKTSSHSVQRKNYRDRLVHTSYHEIAHTVVYDNWGVSEYDNGEVALQADYDKFGVTGQVVGKYGKSDVSEHFAEALARYITVGDATPEFRALLESKNLLKSGNNSASTTKKLPPSASDIDAPTIKPLKGPRKPYSPKAGVTSSKDAKEKVLSALLDKVKSGEAPWRKPFKDGFSFAGAFVPRNPASKRVYSGLNSLVLKLHQQLEGYEDPRWMTYNQAQSLGGQVRKGEKGTPILVPFKRVKKEKDAGTGEEKITGGYVTFSAKTVFNVAQIDGLNLPDLKTEAGEPKTPLEAQDFIIERYKKSMEAKGLKTPEINYTYVGEYGSHSSSPNWRPSSDEITLPTKEQFNSPEDMFDTMTHELAHSTGHPTRLDRSELTKNYSSDNASRGKEELIAEIAAAILASMFGVNSDFDNTAAYVKSWLKALQDNPEMIVGASSDAQKVVDYLLGMDLGDWSPIEGYSTAAKSDKEDE
jgi:antirestriction protein ArdC